MAGFSDEENDAKTSSCQKERQRGRRRYKEKKVGYQRRYLKRLFNEGRDGKETAEKSLRKKEGRRREAENFCRR